jgi:hypothetical protein
MALTRMKEYTEEQKFSNYKFLARSIRELKAGREINQHDVEYFKLIRYYCQDFNYANTEVEDAKFRKKANETEQMCRYLNLYLAAHKTIERSVYVQLLERIDFMFKHIVPYDEVSMLMGDLQI